MRYISISDILNKLNYVLKTIPLFFVLLIYTLAVFGNKRIYILLSNSMYPTLKLGDIIVVDKNTPNVLKKGDIILYTHKQQNIVHRIYTISTDMSQIRTKGDNNNVPDIYNVTKTSIKGIYYLKISRLIWLFLLSYIYAYIFKF